MLYQDVFVGSMGTTPDSTHPVKCWDAKRRGEIPVRSSSCGGFFEGEADCDARDWACLKRHTIPGDLSMGGRLIPPVIVREQAGSVGARLRSRVSM